MLYFALVVFLFGGRSFLSSWKLRDFTTNMIKEVRICPDSGSRKNIHPNKKIAKWFKIKQWTVPKYLYYELYVSIFFAILFPIHLTITILFYALAPEYIWLMAACKQVLIHVILILVNYSFLLIRSLLWKRKYK